MRFEVTFDYLCPFARNAHEAVIEGMRAGADWEVAFRPFSLAQAHVEEGEPDALGDLTASGVRALQWSLAVRETQPEHFSSAHVALFAARHDRGLDISEESVIRQTLGDVGVDVDSAAEVVASEAAAKVLTAEHNEAVERWAVFGVPTFSKVRSPFLSASWRGAMSAI